MHIFVIHVVMNNVLLGGGMAKQLVESDADVLVDLLSILEFTDFPVGFSEIVLDGSS